VSKVITLFAGTVLAKYPEMEDSCREIFRDILYSIRDKGLKCQLDCDLCFKDTAQADKEGLPVHPKGVEVEIMKVDDLVEHIDDLIDP
jgi:sulfatase maturation enzyme AslB (radical SAM superfamily)